ncbi:MAG: sodium-dependent transporter [Calditrichaeota bacterium]|nr:MAG: sodium-dependent transporter [Calditrichota bacterium]
MKGKEHFTSRWALLLATMGMAIGAGNIWRFPRLAGQYGGAFLIPWLIFLILWSIPLLMVEFSMGKHTRQGPIGAFASFLGKKFTWMGGFVAICTMAIMFYYSVVTGWALKYFIAGISGQLLNADHQAFWNHFTSSGYEPLVYHFISLSIAGFIIYQGVVRGIERANRVLLPALLVLLIIGAIRALTLPNAAEGLNYFFGFHGHSLRDPKMWLEGLSQSAWSTGAGWGLVLTYAVYMRDEEDVTLNAFITGFGNNSASLLAGLAIIPAIFSLAPTIAEAEKALQAGNQGLSFIVVPQLFSSLPGARWLISLFFLALFFAAMSSLISMFELATRVLMDFGLSRRKALPVVAGLTAVFGAPSALSLKIFNNQDWVWGLGLILSGFFFAFAIMKTGVEKFRQQFLLQPENDLYIGGWFNWVLKILIPIEAVVLLVWWLYQSMSWEARWWYPLGVTNLGTCISQWVLLILLLLVVNRYLYHHLVEKKGE